MAATPQFGQLLYQGISGRTYNIDIYLSDVANALIRFDGGSGASATSPDSWPCPEPGHLVDYSQVTGTADTTKLSIQRGNNPSGNILRYTIHLTTLALRPSLRIPFGMGQLLRATQLA